MVRRRRGFHHVIGVIGGLIGPGVPGVDHSVMWRDSDG
jgi:hypothetical protein